MGLSASSYLEDSEGAQPTIRISTSTSTISSPEPLSPLCDHQEKRRITKEIDLDDTIFSPTVHKLKSIDSQDRDKTFLYYSRQDEDGYFKSSQSITYSQKEIDEIAESTDSLDQFLKFKADQFWNEHQKSIEAQREYNEYNEQMMLMQQIQAEEEEQMRCERLQQLQQNLNQITAGIHRLQMEYKTYCNYFQQQYMQNMTGSNLQNVQQQQYQQQIEVLNQNYVLQMNQFNVNVANIKKEIELLSNHNDC